VLVNNAGIGSFGQTPDLDPAQWTRVIEVDLHSVFYGCRAAIPHLREGGGGAIVNTASISGLRRLRLPGLQRRLPRGPIDTPRSPSWPRTTPAT